MKVNWIDVNDGLPEKSGEYLCFAYIGDEKGYVSTLTYSKKYKKFNCHDSSDEEHIDKVSLDVTHWCELPDPPKGYIRI